MVALISWFDPGLEFLDDSVAHFDAAFLGGAAVGCRHKDRLGTVLVPVSLEVAAEAAHGCADPGVVSASVPSGWRLISWLS